MKRFMKGLALMVFATVSINTAFAVEESGADFKGWKPPTCKSGKDCGTVRI